MILFWLALAWMAGIVLVDTSYNKVDITLPIDEYAVIYHPLTHSPTTVTTFLQHIMFFCIALAVVGVFIALVSRFFVVAGKPRLAHGLLLIGLCISSAAAGGLRHQAAQTHTTPHSVWLLVNQPDIAIQGYVEEDPRRDEEGQRVLLHTTMAHVGEHVQVVEGVILLTLPPYPAYHYGQQLVAYGTLTHPRAARQASDFDYRAYLAREGVFALMPEPDYVRVIDGSMVGSPFLIALLTLRDNCQQVLLRELPEPEASLAIGTVLGLKAAIPDVIYDSFSVVGATHMLVISGWQLTIVAGVFSAFATRLRLNATLTFWLLITTIWLYTVFVGMDISVVRSAIMASLVTIAQTTYRRTEPWTLLTTACLILSIFDSQVLWQVGLQLSVMATASLFAFATDITRWLIAWCTRTMPHWLPLEWLLEQLGITIAAQILVLPIILYHFGNLSLVSPLANVLLVPMLPYAMFGSIIALILGMLWLPLGQLTAALVAWAPLAGLIWIAHILAHLPWASIHFPQIPFWSIVVYYVIIVAWYNTHKKHRDHHASPM